MGEPAELTTEQRADVQAMARHVVEAGRNDENPLVWLGDSGDISRNVRDGVGLLALELVRLADELAAERDTHCCHCCGPEGYGGGCRRGRNA